MTSRDETFRAFTPQQAASYATGRGQPYPDELYNTLFEYHQGPRRLLLDIGTGPGKVVIALAGSFERGVGCDASPEMVERAKQDAAAQGLTDKTAFVVCGGEECDKALPQGEAGRADVITVAMAAHWLELPGFYAAAGRALRPGGTLAMWISGGYGPDASTPQSERLQEIVDAARDMLLPYSTPGNRLAQSGYEGIELPWTVSPAVTAFSEASFARKEWNRNGTASAPAKADGSPGASIAPLEVTPEKLEAAVSSGSSVIRWREANADKAYGEEDPVKLTTKRLRETLGEEARLVVRQSWTMLLMRKGEGEGE